MAHLEATSAASRQRWVGRLAALFFVGGGVLGLATLPLAPEDADELATSIVAALAIVAGAIVWGVPWERRSRRATLVVVPPALALIAAGNVYGGTDYFTYGIFFVIVFVWVGLAHPPWMCVAVAPLAIVAYLVPLATLPGADVGAGVGSMFIVILDSPCSLARRSHEGWTAWPGPRRSSVASAPWPRSSERWTR